MGAGILCAGVPRVPTPGCLCGVGQGLVPCGSPAGDGASRDAAGTGSRSASWLDEPKSGCPEGWRRVALSPLSWVLLNEEVWFHQSKATAVWIRDPAADYRGGVSV